MNNELNYQITVLRRLTNEGVDFDTASLGVFGDYTRENVILNIMKEELEPQNIKFLARMLVKIQD